MILIPAVYVGLAARPTWAIGRRLLILAIGWTLLEAGLHLHNVIRPHEGLLTASQQVLLPEALQNPVTAAHGDGLHLHWLLRLLGYVCTALLVACANASLVGILSGARLSFPACRSLAGAGNAIGQIASQVILAIQSWTLRQAHPRAPPR